MKKRWINCTELLKYHDVPPAESVQAITSGKIDAYSSQLRKIVNVRHYELKKNTRDAILSEIDIVEQETGKRPLVSFAPDAAHVGEFLGAGAEKLIKNRWDNNIPTYYIIHPHGTLPINLGWLESILQNPSRKVQCEELSFIQFKYEDAVRCFGLATVGNAPAPAAEVQDNPAGTVAATPSTDVSGRTTIDQAGDAPIAEVQDVPVVEAQPMPKSCRVATKKKQQELARRMEAEGKKHIEIAVALWPDDSETWVNGKDRLDKKTLDKERNRLEKKVGRLIPRAD